MESTTSASDDGSMDDTSAVARRMAGVRDAVLSIPLTTRFRGITTRETMLVEAAFLEEVRLHPPALVSRRALVELYAQQRRFDAQLAVFDLRDPRAPCYACLYPEDGQAEEVACATMGSRPCWMSSVWKGSLPSSSQRR